MVEEVRVPQAPVPPAGAFAEVQTTQERFGGQRQTGHRAPPGILGISTRSSAQSFSRRRSGWRDYVGPVTYWVLKGILTPIFFVLWQVKVEGRENIPKKGPVVLAANHQSFCDSFFLPLVVRRKVTFLAKAEYFDSKK